MMSSGHTALMDFGFWILDYGLCPYGHAPLMYFELKKEKEYALIVFLLGYSIPFHHSIFINSDNPKLSD